VNKIIRRTSEGSGQSALGYFHFASGLVWGHLIGNIAFSTSGLIQIRKDVFRKSAFQLATLKYVISRFSNFPKFQAFPFFLNTLSFMLPVIIVNILYSQEITGFFDLTRQVLALPLALVSTSLSKVMLQDISEKRNALQPIKSRMLKTLSGLSFLAVPGILVMIFWSEMLFGFVFGAQWTVSGKIAGILVFSYAIKFVVSPLSSVLVALERLQLLAVWRILYFTAILSLFLLENIDVLMFFTIYTAIDVLFYTIYFVLIWFAGTQYERSLTSNYTR
jgi:O-antigen/teichoic acid export membrane protein